METKKDIRAALAELRKQLKTKQFLPIYFLYGEENYFIDKFTDMLRAGVLAETDPAFNHEVFYGEELRSGKLAQLLSACRSYPVFAEWRLVEIREAQRMGAKELEKLLPYFENPIPSTVLLIAWRDRSGPDGRSKPAKALQKYAFIECKLLYESQIRPYIEEMAAAKNLQLSPDALQLLIEYLGTNLQLIENEIEKLSLTVAAGATVTRDQIYQAIDVDREFNVFELLNEIGNRNVYQSHLIAAQMLQNKEVYIGGVLSQLFKFFLEIAILQEKNILTENGIAAYLKVHPFLAKRWLMGLQRYPMPLPVRNLHWIRQADLALKGITEPRFSEEHIFKTLIYRILNN
jgi:DNA polymerase-3 subunit delta